MRRSLLTTTGLSTSQNRSSERNSRYSFGPASRTVKSSANQGTPGKQNQQANNFNTFQRASTQLAQKNASNTRVSKVTKTNQSIKQNENVVPQTTKASVASKPIFGVQKPKKEFGLELNINSNKEPSPVISTTQVLSTKKTTMAGFQTPSFNSNQMAFKQTSTKNQNNNPNLTAESSTILSKGTSRRPQSRLFQPTASSQVKAQKQTAAKNKHLQSTQEKPSQPRWNSSVQAPAIINKTKQTATPATRPSTKLEKQTSSSSTNNTKKTTGQVQS